MRCFAAKDYEFSHMIETDGIACSILLVRKDMAEKRKKPRRSKPKELYIHDAGADFDKLKGKTVVCCNTLIYTLKKTLSNLRQNHA